jgi:hypothetical protein
MSGFDIEKELQIWTMTAGAFLDHYSAMLDEGEERKQKNKSKGDV